MNEQISNEEWASEWRQFLQNILYLGEIALIVKRGRRFQELNQILRYVINLLLEEMSTNRIVQALQQTQEMDGERNIIIITGNELIYFNQHVIAPLRINAENVNFNQIPDGIAEGVDDSFAAGKNIKDSIENKINLGPIVKRLLHGLNEIMSLFRGGA